MSNIKLLIMKVKSVYYKAVFYLRMYNNKIVVSILRKFKYVQYIENNLNELAREYKKHVEENEKTQDKLFTTIMELKQKGGSND